MSANLETDSTSKELKRTNIDGGGCGFTTSSACWCDNFRWKKQKICPKEIGHADPLFVDNMLEGLDSNKYRNVREDRGDLIARRNQLLSHCSATMTMVPCKNLGVERSPSEEDFGSNKYGSVTKEIEELLARGEQLFGALCSTNFTMSCKLLEFEMHPSKEILESKPPAMPYIIDLDDDNELDNGTIVKFEAGEEIATSAKPPTVIDLDYEDLENDKNCHSYEVVDLTKPADNFLTKNIEVHGTFVSEFDQSVFQVH